MSRLSPRAAAAATDGVGADRVVPVAPLPPAGALVGYAGVCAGGPQLDRQVRVLTGAGCVRVLADRGAGAARPGLAACTAGLRRGDTLVVASLDRLSPSLPGLTAVVTELRRRGVGLRSLQEGLDTSDTTTPGGQLVADLFVPLAEFIQDLVERASRRGSVRTSATVSAPVSEAASRRDTRRHLDPQVR